MYSFGFEKLVKSYDEGAKMAIKVASKGVKTCLYLWLFWFDLNKPNILHESWKMSCGINLAIS
jgi:hypothetical protein